MPIRQDLKPLYGAGWPDVSNRIRFDRADGFCENCQRPHDAIFYSLSGGGWIDPATGEAWLAGVPASELKIVGTTRLMLACAHLDHDPTNGADENLSALCQRCHMIHDQPHHQAQRRITLRSRWAIGDLFEGLYGLSGYPRNA
jgi:hypothetical protein